MAERVNEEDILWSREDLLNELADICWKIDDLEKQITSAMESMGEVQKEMMNGRFGALECGLADQILSSLRRTIDNLSAAQGLLKIEHEELIAKGLELDPLFLCSR